MPRPDTVIVNTFMRQALLLSGEGMGVHRLNTVLRTSGLECFRVNLRPNGIIPSVKPSEDSEAVLYPTGVEHEIVETHCIANGEVFCRFEVGVPQA